MTTHIVGHPDPSGDKQKATQFPDPFEPPDKVTWAFVAYTFVRQIPSVLGALGLMIPGSIAAYYSYHGSRQGEVNEARIDHAISKQAYTEQQLDSIGAKVDKGMGKDAKKGGPFE